MSHDRECSCESSDVAKIVVGGLIGAGIALLLAPQAGKKTRRYLSDYAKNFGGKANDACNDFAESLSEFVDHAGERASELLHEGTDLTNESKKALLRALEKGQEILEKQRKRLESMID
ncbi:YtxH domain-containing protein [Geomonas sp. Red32]|uniref:YtxH domain-containing protein n=1 Tax=Geomonas sp. Red32 TaxID=2912856 RepID=UPI00202CA93B|nr:YtxH domain-containing protein [Geomonas sp. Red32]MCM0081344.1 YtxH domain-containing protein [Geomonas sp. Red32]